MSDKANAIRIHVHDDSRVLDGMFRLVELAKFQRPIDDTLAAICRLISEVAQVDVVSVYLRERHGERDVLVMRGNVGFPPTAIGHVQLGLYEGLTGVVAERRRPVSVAVAQEDNRYKHVDGIGEEQFAAYLGVPLLAADEVAGVLVLQRRVPGAFTDGDVALASSMTAPLMFAIERAGVSLSGGQRSWVGTSLVAGRAVGRALVLPARTAAAVSEPAALHALEFDLVTAAQRLGHAAPVVARALENLELVANALREQVAADDGADVLARLERAPYHAASGARDLRALVDERHREVRELWSFLALDIQHRLSICGAVLVARSLGAFMAIEAVARGAAAVVIATTAEPAAREVLAAARLPAICGVPDLVDDIACGALLDVDASRGVVRCRPS